MATNIPTNTPPDSLPSNRWLETPFTKQPWQDYKIRKSFFRKCLRRNYIWLVSSTLLLGLLLALYIIYTKQSANSKILSKIPGQNIFFRSTTQGIYQAGMQSKNLTTKQLQEFVGQAFSHELFAQNWGQSRLLPKEHKSHSNSQLYYFTEKKIYILIENNYILYAGKKSPYSIKN